MSGLGQAASCDAIVEFADAESERPSGGRGERLARDRRRQLRAMGMTEDDLKRRTDTARAVKARTEAGAHERRGRSRRDRRPGAGRRARRTSPSRVKSPSCDGRTGRRGRPAPKPTPSLPRTTREAEIQSEPDEAAPHQSGEPAGPGRSGRRTDSITAMPHQRSRSPWDRAGPTNPPVPPRPPEERIRFGPRRLADGTRPAGRGRGRPGRGCGSRGGRGGGRRRQRWVRGRHAGPRSAGVGAGRRTRPRTRRWTAKPEWCCRLRKKRRRGIPCAFPLWRRNAV